MQFLALCTYLTQRRLYNNFVLKAIVFVYIVSTSVWMCTEEIVPARVSRRLTGDAAFSESDSCTCINEGNLTYLVEERQCVKNQDLLNGNQS